MPYGRLAVLLAVLASPLRHAGAQARVDSAALRPRTLRAVRLVGPPPTIDGRLDEAIWQTAPVAADFVQSGPTPGAPARWRTEARVAYDDAAVYVAVRACDPHPDSIVAPYPRRDDETTSDWLFAEFDSRHDHRSGFSFGINPRSVQADGDWADDDQYDSSWDGVWEGAARIDSLGWTAEFRIPFSQLPHGDGGTWGFNIYRYVGRSGEASDWAPRLPTEAGVISHFNTLEGLGRLPSDRVLEVTPYVAMTEQRSPASPGNPFVNAGATSPSAGADVRLGLGSGFSAVATVHPDFGQVEADPSVINLTSFETFLTERRPFFVQQAGLFRFPLGLAFHTRGDDFSSDQPFYSRRIGGPPHGLVPGNAQFNDAPDETTILGASKVAGYTERGWSIGVLNAVTDAVDAQFTDSMSDVRHTAALEPLTSYTVVNIARSFDDGRSAVGGIATAVDRFGHGTAFDSILPHDALTAGIDGRYRFGAARNELSGFLLGSRVAGTPAAIASVFDGPGHYLHMMATQSSAEGAAGELRVARIGGDHWRWALLAHAISPEFDVSDVGFQNNSDWLLAVGSFSYSDFHPHGIFNSWTLGSNQIGEGWTFAGVHRANVVNATLSGELRNYVDFSLSVDHELPAISTDLLRGGPPLGLPARDNIVATMTSDRRRTTQLTLTDTTVIEPGTGTLAFAAAPLLDFRASDHARLVIGPEYAHAVDGWQFVDGAGGQYVLGRLRQQTFSLTVHATYAFSRTITLELYANPFVSANRYDEFKTVERGRVMTLGPSAIRYDSVARTYAVGSTTFANPTFTEKDLHANAILRWEFRPGSTLFVIWTQARERAAPDIVTDLSDAASGVFQPPPTNTFLIKVSYWLGR